MNKTGFLLVFVLAGFSVAGRAFTPCVDWTTNESGYPFQIFLNQAGQCAVFSSDPSSNFQILRYDVSGGFLGSTLLSTGMNLDNAVSIEANGDIAVTGQDTGSLHSRVVVCDAGGNSLLTMSDSIGSNSNLASIATDASGNILAAGYYYNGVRHVGRASKFDASGNLVWSRDDTSGSDSQETGAAFDLSGNAVVSGSSDSLTLRTTKYDPSGNTLWARSDSSGATYLVAQGTCIDAQGNVFAAAWGLYGFSLDSAHMVKYDPSGNLLWSRTFGDGISNYNVSSVACDPQGDVLLAASKSINSNCFILYDSNGNLLSEYSDDRFNGSSASPAAILNSNQEVFFAAQIPGVSTRVAVTKYKNAGCMPTPTPPTSVQSLGSNRAFVYPEPVRGDLANLGLSMQGPGTVKLTIFNAAMNPVARVQEHKDSGSQYISFHTGSYASGVYYYTLSVQYDSGDKVNFPSDKFRVIR